jgi:hypothetical protein
MPICEDSASARIHKLFRESALFAAAFIMLLCSGIDITMQHTLRHLIRGESYEPLTILLDMGMYAASALMLALSLLRASKALMMLFEQK